MKYPDHTESIQSFLHLPTQPIVSSSGYAPELLLGMHGISLARLPRALRLMLLSDGTVTRQLEAYFWEPVRVRVQSQQLISVDCAIPALACNPKEAVMVRKVAIQGEQTGRHYASALSLILVKQLSLAMTDQDSSNKYSMDHSAFQHKLEEQQQGIGTLIETFRMPSSREILKIGCHNECSESEVFRVYRIKLAKHPAVLIKEVFPIDSDHYNENNLEFHAR